MIKDPTLRAWIRNTSIREKLEYRAYLVGMRIRKAAAIACSARVRRHWRNGADVLMVGKLDNQVPWTKVAAICRLSGIPLATFVNEPNEGTPQNGEEHRE